MIFGFDYLAGAKYQNLILQEHPDGWAAGIFTQKELFGDGLVVMDKLAAKGKCPAIRLNFHWEDTHRFDESIFPKIIAEAKRAVPLIKKYPNIQWYVSGATEHNLNAKLAKKLATQVLAVMPDYVQYINNPWTNIGGAWIWGDRILNETHGTPDAGPAAKGKWTFSYDGSNSLDDDVEYRKKKLAKAQIFFMWHPSMNGRLTTNDKTPRPQRNSFPTPEILKAMKYVAVNTAPKATWPGNTWLWKNNSDRHETPPEPRAYKPVLITPVNCKSYTLHDSKGNLLETSGPRMDFADGRNRYYFDEFGYRIALRAEKATGSPIVTLKGDGKVYGKFNPAFRTGNFRD